MASTTTASDPQMPSTSAMAIASEMPSTSDPQEQSAPLAVGVAMKTRSELILSKFLVSF